MRNSITIPWPGWEAVRLIGRGSFGEVYEIQRDNFGAIEKAALKIISIPQSQTDIDELYQDGYDTGSITARFNNFLEGIVKEYSLMAEMKGHTNIVYCDDLSYSRREDGIGWDIYIKMELLTPMMKSLPAQIEEAQAIQVGMDICSALAHCKKKNIIHRDIKPQNIFVSESGNYKLGDFGVAKTTEKTTAGTKVGTYKYMAPEVYRSEPYNARADICSLGLVMYWMLNERRMPFMPLPPQIPTVTMEEDARQRRFSGEPLPAPAHGSKELQRIVLKACAFNPQDRYASADEMLQDLCALADRTARVFGPLNDPPHQPPKKPKQPGGPKPIFCCYCGRENRPGATFCAGCGKSLVVKKTDPPKDPPKDPPPEVTDDSVTRKNKRLFPIVILVLALLAVLVLGAAFVLTHLDTISSSGIGSSQHDTDENPGRDEDEDTPDAEDEDTEPTDAPTEDPAEVAYRDAEERCQELADVGSYEEAVLYLRECAALYPDDARYETLLLSYEDTLRSYTLQQAQAYADQQQYKQAVQTIQNVQDTYHCSDFDNAIAQYSAQLTSPLSFCPVLSDSNAAGSSTDVCAANWIDCFNTSHPNSLRFWVAKRANWNNTEHIEYDLAGQYQTLSGQIVAEETSATDAYMEILIYLDGVLVYQSGSVAYGAAPIEFTISVADAQQIRIECTTESSSFGYCIVDAALSEI